ncbi:hypothetical protein M011DRAFT_153165 [Sporormia fimetaria CBS 119925]|uniref:Uncharacterized protein n=1 Tax=Sporormia fimetaria CBS 119925 TaxID=1340428 RepID=A0A6A6V6U3_9PLEO|nr:hypothetical protein M011DRAFT_153165 [Sporormia fimetaria CBS 119925]
MRQYPGLGLPLRHYAMDFGTYPIGVHGDAYGSKSGILPVRELAMMHIMEQLTDKPEWHKKVFEEDIVAKWRREALEIPDEVFCQMAGSAKKQRWKKGEIEFEDDDGWVDSEIQGVMSEAAFEFCIQELRAKAKYFERTGIIPTLDASASAAKSDTVVSSSLQQALRNAYYRLQEDQASFPDLHHRASERVQDLVNPSMYPLVYGRSGVFKEEVVGVTDAVHKWAGKGGIISNPDPEQTDDYQLDSGDARPHYWSETYQWLPSNIAFQSDGSVKFTSYINNLHPTKYPEIYRAIEELVDTVLPLWDQCLPLASGQYEREGAGRAESRFSRPEDPDDDNKDNWFPTDPEDPPRIWSKMTDDQRAEWLYNYCDDEEQILEELRKEIRVPRLPDPDVQVTDFAPARRARLAERFRQSGLQVIVKLTSIELTPETPVLPIDGWHIEGQMNEHICGTALYHIDSDNITPSNLCFRMQTSDFLNSEFELSDGGYGWLQQVYGTGLGEGCGHPCLQNYGSVEMRKGRLLAFPNVFHNRLSPFSLQDRTKPGHCRFIALYLVDPTIRIISTANVPPQQQSWWLDAAFGSTENENERKQNLDKLPPEVASLLAEEGCDVKFSNLRESKLPPELMDMVKKYFDASLHSLPMSAEEASMHRERLMQERSAFAKAMESEWQRHSYGFC